MRYYIDGYNLLFNLSHHHFSSLTTERQRIVSELDILAQSLNLNVCVVFDGKHQKDTFNRHFCNRIEIYFSKEGETADDLLVSLIKESQNPSQSIVVTSDRELSFRIRLYNAKNETVESFINTMVRRYHKKVSRKKLVHKKKSKTCSVKAEKTISAPKELTFSSSELLGYYHDIFCKRLEQANIPLEIKSQNNLLLETFERQDNNH